MGHAVVPESNVCGLVGWLCIRLFGVWHGPACHADLPKEATYQRDSTWKSPNMSGIRVRSSGTWHKYWVYRPARMIRIDRLRSWFSGWPGPQSGLSCAVFGNLIDAEMPVTIGVFINPGNRGIRNWSTTSESPNQVDSPNGDYAQFLETEILSSRPALCSERRSRDAGHLW